METYVKQVFALKEWFKENNLDESNLKNFLQHQFYVESFRWLKLDQVEAHVQKLQIPLGHQLSIKVALERLIPTTTSINSSISSSRDSFSGKSISQLSPDATHSNFVQKNFLEYIESKGLAIDPTKIRISMTKLGHGVYVYVVVC